jgi:protein gp37
LKFEIERSIEMGAQTNIQWCDHTYNPWRGCRKVAAECENCYITGTTPFRVAGQTHGSVRVRAGEDHRKEPLRWNKKAAVAGERERVFCLSLGDWLDDENVPIEWLCDLLKMIQATPWLDWLLLTKRPGNFQKRVGEVAYHWGTSCEIAEWWAYRSVPPNNVWIGVSQGADQAAALAIPAAVHFLSCEPMLRPLDTTHAARFDWIIFGGESGPGARSCDIEWIQDGISYCRVNGIAPFVKQLGSNCLQARQLKHKKGGDMAEWPEQLRVREFPKVK